LEIQARLLLKISEERRFFAEYFRVGFYGKGFDQNITGKEFIYRGLELEKRDDFMERMTSLFPNAQILTFADEPGDDIINGAAQYLQILPVKPASREEMEGKPSKIPENMPTALQKYYQTNDVNIFVFSKPVRKTKTDNEFLDLWLRNFYYITEDTFPTIHRRLQIIQKVLAESSPPEVAFKAVVDKNKELKELILHYKSITENEPINPLSMQLQGVVQAAVNGGTDKYKQAFFNDGYLASNPSQVNLISQLKEQLLLQLVILEDGMKVHKMKCDEKMIAFHDVIEGKFIQMKAESRDIAAL